MTSICANWRTTASFLAITSRACGSLPLTDGGGRRLNCAPAHTAWCAPVCSTSNRQAILRESVRHADVGAAHEPTDASDDVPEAEFKTLLQTAPGALRSYFDGWEGLVPAPMIGALLGLLGPHLRELAERYLQPHSFEWLVGRLPPWKDPEWAPQPLYLALDRAKATASARSVPLDIVNTGVVVPEGGDVQVHNLLGQTDAGCPRS